MKRQIYKLKDTAQTDYTTLDPQNLHLFVDENSEAWANNQSAFTNLCEIYFTGNPDSPIGTNFETILLTKNATLSY